MAVNNLALTEKTLEGEGVFDRLMAAARVHLDREYTLGRIKGPEYAEVYLGALTAVMDQSVKFLLERDIVDLRLEMMALEREKLALERDKAAAEIPLIQAQTALINQQVSNLALEREKLAFERDKAAAEIPLIQAQTALAEQQVINLQVEALNIPKQGLVLDAQKCKLDAEFDLLVEQKARVVAEKELVNQKKLTEQAQTNGNGVTSNSVIGRQMDLYLAQRDGFHRNAEQQAAKIMVDTWMARRTTDETTAALPANGLDDPNIGRAITALLAGVNA